VKNDRTASGCTYGLMVANFHPIGRAVNWGIKAGDAIASDDPQDTLDLLMSGPPGATHLPKPPPGFGTVPQAARDPKRLFNADERAAQRHAQGGVYADGCGTKIDSILLDNDSYDMTGQRVVRMTPSTSASRGNRCSCASRAIRWR